MTAQAFLQAVKGIVAERPTYRLGGNGSDGTCDCVGLLMGAMDRVQRREWPLHSSNYFSRWMIDRLDRIDDAVLLPGMAVVKGRTNTGELNDRYKSGGRYYNGDLRDYYHIGVVVSTQPLMIQHCTSGGGVSGIVTDTSLRGWTHAGRITDIAYVEDIEMPDTKRATIRTEDGNPLKLRADPSTKKPFLAKMPNGDRVDVYADAQGWAKVVWKGYTGYCMSQFLVYDEPDGGIVDGIVIERELAQRLLETLTAQMGRG